MPGGYPPFNLFIHVPIPSILPTICPPSTHPFTHPSRLFNYPFIYPPTHHSIYLPTIFLIFHASLYLPTPSIYSIIHLSIHPLSIPHSSSSKCSQQVWGGSWKGLRAMEKCSSACNAHTPARGGKGKHHVPRGGALCPEGSRNPEVSKKSSKWCDLHFSQHFSMEGRGYGQVGGARLPETDRVIWQTS